MSDKGARNLLFVFLTVWGALGLFYAFLAWRSLIGFFFIQNNDSERSKVTLVSAARIGEVEQAAILFEVEHAASLFKSVVDNMPSSAIQRGKNLYLRSGCALCHGLDGKGGVKSQNYVKGTVPALNTLAEKMLIWEEADAEKLISLLAANKPIEEAEDLDLPNTAAVVAQCQSVRDVIERGQAAGKQNRFGLSPIDMPGWKQKLSRQDINLIIAYLLSLYRWEEEE